MKSKFPHSILNLMYEPPNSVDIVVLGNMSDCAQLRDALQVHFSVEVCHEVSSQGAAPITRLIADARLGIVACGVQHESDLKLMSVITPAELTQAGESLIVVALVDDYLHIRVFDADGQEVVDKPEAELVSGQDFTYLKELLNEDPFPDASELSEEMKREIIEKATAISLQPFFHRDAELLQSIAEAKKRKLSLFVPTVGPTSIKRVVNMMLHARRQLETQCCTENKTNSTSDKMPAEHISYSSSVPASEPSFHTADQVIDLTFQSFLAQENTVSLEDRTVIVQEPFGDCELCVTSAFLSQSDCEGLLVSKTKLITPPKIGQVERSIAYTPVNTSGFDDDSPSSLYRYHINPPDDQKCGIIKMGGLIYHHPLQQELVCLEEFQASPPEFEEKSSFNAITGYLISPSNPALHSRVKKDGTYHNQVIEHIMALIYSDVSRMRTLHFSEWKGFVIIDEQQTDLVYEGNASFRVPSGIKTGMGSMKVFHGDRCVFATEMQWIIPGDKFTIGSR